MKHLKKFEAFSIEEMEDREVYEEKCPDCNCNCNDCDCDDCECKECKKHKHVHESFEEELHCDECDCKCDECQCQGCQCKGCQSYKQMHESVNEFHCEECDCNCDECQCKDCQCKGCKSWRNQEVSEKRKTSYKKSGLKNPEKADLNKDGKISGYEKTRGKAVQKAVEKEKEEKGSKGLTKAQKKLPAGLQKAILARKKK